MANNDDLRAEDAYHAFETVGRIIFLAIAKFFIGLVFGGLAPAAVAKPAGQGGLVTTAEAKELLKVSNTKFWQLAKKNDFGRVDIGGRPKWDKKLITQFIDKQKG